MVDRLGLKLVVRCLIVGAASFGVSLIQFIVCSCMLLLAERQFVGCSFGRAMNLRGGVWL